MAKVIVEIEDLPGGKVKCTVSPTFESMMKIMVSGSEITAAQGYVVGMLNWLRKESKKNDPRTMIDIPRLKPGRML